MVALTPRFALLASLATIAALSGLPQAHAAAVQSRRQADGYNSYRMYGHSRRFNHAHTRTINRRSETPAPSPSPSAPPSQGKTSPAPPTLPLPVIGQSKVKSEGAGGSATKVKPSQQENKRWDPFGPLLQVGKIWIGDNQPPLKRQTPHLLGRHSQKVKQSTQNAHDQEANRQSSSSGGTDGVSSLGGIIGGAGVYRRAPHDHSHERTEEMYITGDYDHVTVQEKRDEARYGGLGSSQLLSRRDSQYTARETVFNNETLDMHLKRDSTQSNGVPGTIDIMSAVANSTTGQRIASLFLPPTAANGTYQEDVTFVLNASSTNATQIYLVTHPDPEPDSSGTTDPTTPATNTNSTMPSNSPSMVPSADGFDSNMSNSTATDSAAPGSPSSSSSNSYLKATLEIPMFNSVNASMERWCATFDLIPPRPANLTAEKCLGPNETHQNKSQVFAYDPSTGAVRPMWHTGQDDGTDDAQDANHDGGDDDGDDDGDEINSPGSNTTSVAPQDPTTPASSKMASVTSAMVLDAQFGDATRPAAFAHSFAETNSTSAPPNARKVTMVFTPAAPQIVSLQRAEAMGTNLNPPAGTSSNSTDSTTATLTSPASGTSASAAAIDYYSSGYSSYTASSTDSAAATGSATSTAVSAAEYDDGYDYSATTTAASSSASTSPIDTYPTASYPSGSGSGSGSGSTTSASAAGFGFSSETTSVASVSCSSAVASSTGVPAAAYDFSLSSAIPSASVTSTSVSTASSASGGSAAAFDIPSTSTPTASASVNATFVSTTGSPTAAALDVSSSVSVSPSDCTSTSDTSSPTSMSAAAFDTSTLSATSALASASSTNVSAEAAVTSTLDSATSSTAAPNPTANALGVEVFDPNFPSSEAYSSYATFSPSGTSTSESSTATLSVSAQAVHPASSSGTSMTVTGTVVSSSAPSTMTPVSTAPYEWMFKEGTLQS